MGSKHWRLIAVLAAILIVGAVATAGAIHDGDVILHAQLDGRNEVADNATNRGIVADPNGTGEAVVFGLDGAHDTLCYVLVVDKIEPALAAHIHVGAAGVNGPIVVPLEAPADGSSADCVTGLAAVLVADILANPAGYYVNVHNADFPGGAVRGQLAPL